MGNKLRTTVSASAIALGIALSSQAAMADGMSNLLGENAYVSVFGSYSPAFGQSSYFDDIYDQVLKDGFSVGVAIGSHVGNGVRIEKELSYVRNKNDKTDYNEPDEDDYFLDYSGNTHSWFLLNNVWKDIDLGMLRPYAGGGVGVAFLTNHGDYDGGDNGWDDTGLGFAAQLGAGARFGLTDRLAIDAGYRLKAVVDASFFHGGSDNDNHSGNSHYSHNFQLGASYALNGQIMPDSDGDSNWYVSLFGGAVLPDNSAFGTNDVFSLDGKTGFSLGAAVGTELSPGLRGELELSYLRYGLKSYSSGTGDSDPASGDVEAGFVLANIWKDINLGMVSPYVGGGLGFALAHIDDGDFNGDVVSDRTGLSLAGQFGFGAKISFTDRMQADIGYRFKSVVEAMILIDEDSDFDNAEFSFHQHVLQAGLTYNLGPSPSVQPVADLPETPDSFYVSLFGGAVMPLDTHVAYSDGNYLVDFKTGFLVGAAVGADISTTLRGELELSHYESNVKDVTEEGTSASDTGEDVKATFLMANLWRDVDLGGFTPYFGGGVGVALMDVDIILDDAGTEEIKDTQLALAAQVGGGLRVPVTDNLTLDAGYRFKTALGVLTEGGFDGTDHGYGSYHSHTGQVGISWKF